MKTSSPLPFPIRLARYVPLLRPALLVHETLKSAFFVEMNVVSDRQKFSVAEKANLPLMDQRAFAKEVLSKARGALNLFNHNRQTDPIEWAGFIRRRLLRWEWMALQQYNQLADEVLAWVGDTEQEMLAW